MRREGLWCAPAVAGLALFAGAPACSTALDPNPYANVDRETFVSRLAAVFCDAIEPCCTRFGHDNSAAACEQEVAIPFAWAYPALANPGSPFDPQMAAACLQATAAYVGRCAGPAFWGQRWDRQMDPSLAPCESVIRPTRQLGETCQSWQDCVTSSGPVMCDLAIPTSAASASVCKLVPPPPDVPPDTYAHVGEPCETELNLEVCIDPCEPGSYCDNGTCAPERASGPCGDLCGRACSASSYCDQTQTCVPRPELPDGASCTSVYQCGNPHPACDQVCGPALLYACKV